MNTLTIRTANPALWAMLVIPIATVVASVWTLRLAIVGADAELPKTYATEGSAFDQDVALREAAERSGVTVALTHEPDGRWLADWSATGEVPRPERLRLSLTHVSDARRDRTIELTPSRGAPLYEGRLEDLGEGRWLIELDAPGQWRLRGRLETPFTQLVLGE